MAAARFTQPELRKPTGSPRPKGRDNAKDTLCRNVLIYGHCRYEDQGCAFNHDPNRGIVTVVQPEVKKMLNVDSPSFTPSTLAVPKSSAISSQAANAAPFTPRTVGTGVTPSPQADAVETLQFNPASIKEFTPSQAFDANQTLPANGVPDAQTSYDPFNMTSLAQSVTTPQYNPYLEDPNAAAASASAYFPAQSAYSAPTQPLQYHLYAGYGPRRGDLLPYQRLAHDFFIPDDLRELAHKRNEATLQVIPNSQLPTVDPYHTLVALDTTHHKSATIFGLPAWVYKATNLKTGHIYCLRRIAGFRLTNEKAIKAAKEWRRVDNAGVVSVVDAFTCRAFGDSSLIFVTNYHPLSKTLVETHFTNTTRYGNRSNSNIIPEHILWGYTVQLANAVKAVHTANLAVRCMEPSKILVTDKARIRLGACAVLDVVQYDQNRPLLDLQQEDFLHFGKLMLALATNNLAVITAQNLKPAMDQLSRNYSPEFRDTVAWLLTSPQSQSTKNIDEFIMGISSHFASAFDASLHANDTLTTQLNHELENGRIARLMMKLGAINERPEFDGEKDWSEVGERYCLKLFRDYVFHQVDANGRPVVDLGHIIRCLNKLDVGSEEKILLVTRDEMGGMVYNYRELNKLVSKSFNELTKPSPAKGRY